MFTRLRSRLSYANVVSSFALFLALTTGGVYAANEWTGANIVDGSLTAADLAVSAVSSTRIKNETITTGDMGPNSVGTSEVVDGSVATADLATGSVGSDEVALESLTEADLATNSVGPTEISDSSIDSGEIVDDSLLAVDLASGSIGGSELANNAVDGANVINNSLSFSDIVGGGTGTTGTVTYPAGSVPNGRCIDTNWAMSGATAGDAAIITAAGPMPSGVLLYAKRVTASNNVLGVICNFSGGAMPAITNLPVRIITFR